MPSLRRVTCTYHVDAAGKRVPAGTPGSTPVTRTNAKWYGVGVPGYPPDKRIPLHANKRVAEQMLADLAHKGARGLIGLPDAAEVAKPLAEHLDGYERHMLEQGASARHVRITLGRLRRATAAAKLLAVADLMQPGARLRLEQAVRALAKGGNDLPAFGAKTAGYYLRDVRTFGRYMHDDVEVIPKNPFAVRRKRRGKKAKAEEATGRRRRVLLPAELARLIDAAKASTREYRGLTGPVRAVLYATAAGTGYRSEELSTFRRESFDLDADPPALSIAAEDSKNGEAARLPLSSGLVAMLAPHLAGVPAGGKVWPGTWNERSARMMRRDLEEAGVPYSVPTAGGGKAVADFHSLRHFYVTSVVGGGASVKVAQRLARHSSPVLTIGTYSHTTDQELAAAVARLPVVGGGGDDPLAKLSRDQLRALVVVMGAALAAAVVPRSYPPSYPAIGPRQGLPETPTARAGRKRGKRE